jgi:hypothetical protein
LEAEGEGMDPRNQKNKSVSFEVSSGSKSKEREKIGLEANLLEILGNRFATLSSSLSGLATAVSLSKSRKW